MDYLTVYIAFTTFQCKKRQTEIYFLHEEACKKRRAFYGPKNIVTKYYTIIEFLLAFASKKRRVLCVLKKYRTRGKSSIF